MNENIDGNIMNDEPKSKYERLSDVSQNGLINDNIDANNDELKQAFYIDVYKNYDITYRNKCCKCTCQNDKMQWCNTHWRCICCQCTVMCCIITFIIFLVVGITFSLLIAYFGGYIWNPIPIKPAPCINNCISFNHTNWDYIVKEYIYQYNNTNIPGTKVDYCGISKDNIFRTYINELNSIDLSRLNSNDQFALYINAYNAFAIKMIIDHTIKNQECKFHESIKDIHQFFGIRDVWHIYIGHINGEKYTLDIIEHDILRKDWNDKRIHAAIVCASISCPDVRMEAYVGYNINNQLHDQFNAFVNNTSKGLAYINTNTVKLSKIFNWYSDDFKPNVSTFISNNSNQNIKTFTNFEYFDYNWNLNIIS